MISRPAILCSLGLCLAGNLAALPTEFPSADFPFSSWQLPPPDPASPPPAGLPASYQLEPLLALAERDRIVSYHEDAASVTLTATLDEHLDLAAEISRAKGRHAVSPVPTGPRIVAGQGDDPENLTFIRLMNGQGIAEIQFLSHPPTVKGGVNVAAARRADGSFRIAAAPISDASVTAIPLFNGRGGRTGGFTLPAGVSAPVLVVAGNFLAEHPGEEFAITSRFREGPLVILSADGAPLRSLGPLLPGSRLKEILIEPVPNVHGGHDLLASSGNRWQRLAFDGEKSIRLDADLPEAGTGVFPSAFDPGRLLVGTADDVRSVLLETDDGITFTPRDVGHFENRFWFDLAPNHAGAIADWKSPADGEYVRSASYAHLRVEAAAPRMRTPASLEATPLWTPAEAADYGRRIFGNFNKPLTEQPIRMWEPTFTHRMGSWFQPWMEVKDPRSGLPRYAMLDRDGHPENYEEGSGTRKSTFLISTYAYGLPALDSLYNQSLRGFLNQLSPRFRENPERVFSLEPNHEHEINIGGAKSVGDYNPKMIEGFFLYLAGLHGADPASINRVMGTSFTTHFDAPRNLGRGAWDETVAGNPFYDAWYFYNRYVINRRIANTFRESLLAGFPAEVIKSHQIPDSFAVASTREFSSSQRRITPVDYALSAGVGFGYTRYGVWYQRANMLDGAHSSGFDSIILGEYNALSAAEKPAVEQLKHIFENGGVGVHCMYWPSAWNPKSPDFNRTMEKAVHDLRANERPRPGYAGGIGRVVPFRDGKRVMNIASLGTGGRHTGLLKSLREDGTWEGSVYTVPFRTAIRAEALAISSARPAAGVTRLSSAPADGLEGGDQLELTFRAQAREKGTVRFHVTYLGTPLPGLSSDLNVDVSAKSYRVVVRSPLPTSGIVLSLEYGDGVKVEAAAVSRQTAEIARLHRGRMTGVRNRGGVSFDVLH